MSYHYLTYWGRQPLHAVLYKYRIGERCFILTQLVQVVVKMPYEFINGNCNGYTNGYGDVHVVDLRSDTISKPTQEMRDAMALAPVGDDVYGEDPTVSILERKSCDLLDKEAAIFLPSGTMANLISIMVHCRERGSEMICGDNSHTFKFEQGGPSAIAGVQSALVKNKEDGTFCLKEMRSRIRENPDCHEPFTSLIVVENTQNMCGGKVLPLDWLDQLSVIAKSYNIPVHMDGARLMNAVVSSKVPAKRIVRDMDSVCFCLSKSLGCPIGSVLLGNKNFIERAKRVRKMLGGGMRQSGIVAAAGLVALDTMIERLQIDHDNTYKIAKAIDDMQSSVVKVDLTSPVTNILMIYLDESRINANEFLNLLYKTSENDSVKVSIRAGSRDSGCVRFVLYWEITNKDVELTIRKLQQIILQVNSRKKL